MGRGLRIAVLSAIGIGCTGLQARSESWPGFRGAAGTAVSTERNLPTKWSADENLKWQTPLRGRGNSCPAVTKDRVYVTSQQPDNTLWVIAVERDSGKILWEKNVGDGMLAAYGPPNMYAHRHNPATPTPSADDDHVWAYFGDGTLICLTKDGQVRWRRNLADEYGEYDLKYGMGSSPRLWGDKLYVACMHKGPSYVAALDKNTGKTIWMTERTMPTIGDGADAYSSPIVLERNGQTQLLINGADHIDAYDPETGKQIWVSGGLKVASEYGRTVASAAIGEDIVVASSANAGNVGRSIALKLGGTGDITKSHFLWKLDRLVDCPTPTCYQGYVYAPKDDGTAVFCIELKTGKIAWKQRLGDGFRASPVAGDGKVYFLSEQGQCAVVAAGPSFKLIATNKLPGNFIATPAISDGKLYLRAVDRLYAVGK